MTRHRPESALDLARSVDIFDRRGVRRASVEDRFVLRPGFGRFPMCEQGPSLIQESCQSLCREPRDFAQLHFRLGIQTLLARNKATELARLHLQLGIAGITDHGLDGIRDRRIIPTTAATQVSQYGEIGNAIWNTGECLLKTNLRLPMAWPNHNN